ncbi:hypothetical protein FB567DRAFT_548188 [Paraphoma chrysanthemicola]|uniref:Uncharacterized protein n=1 Tax=Paraphoma chrysanthemicola TaxID=798071 RepID=A0A8K0VZY8_9PLEO|nr:hypothetical protein FB567DRAFT_548188 [Paraphoma chrysanthemicola]
MSYVHLRDHGQIFFTLDQEIEGGLKSAHGPFLAENVKVPARSRHTDERPWPKVLQYRFEDDTTIASAIRQSKSKPCDIYTVRDLFVPCGLKTSETYTILDLVKDFAISPGPEVRHGNRYKALGYPEKSFLEEVEAISSIREAFPVEPGAAEVLHNCLKQGMTPPGVEADAKKKYEWDVMFGAVMSTGGELKRLVTVTKVHVAGEMRRYPAAIFREIVD